MTRLVTILAAILPAAAIVAGAGPAPAHPAMVPAHDALVAYHLASATGEPIDLRVAYLAGGKHIRFNLPDLSYILVTPAQQAVEMVVPLESTYADMPWETGPQSLFVLDERAHFIRKGDLTVAGQKCTQWDVVQEQDKHTVCVTADGLVLRNQSSDPQGRRNLVEATIVRTEPVPPDLFVVPKEFEKISLDQSLPK